MRHARPQKRLRCSTPTPVLSSGRQPRALAAIKSVFDVVDAVWRGMGNLPGSGLSLRPEYAQYDAAQRFGIPPDAAKAKCRIVFVRRRAQRTPSSQRVPAVRNFVHARASRWPVHGFERRIVRRLFPVRGINNDKMQQYACRTAPAKATWISRNRGVSALVPGGVGTLEDAFIFDIPADALRSLPIRLWFLPWNSPAAISASLPLRHHQRPVDDGSQAHTSFGSTHSRRGTGYCVPGKDAPFPACRVRVAGRAHRVRRHQGSSTGEKQTACSLTPREIALSRWHFTLGGKREGGRRCDRERRHRPARHNRAGAAEEPPFCVGCGVRLPRRCSACPMRCFRRFRSRGPCATPRAAGLAAVVYEIARASRACIVIDEAAVPVSAGSFAAHARFSAWILYIWRTKAGLSPLSLRNRPAPRLRRCTPIRRQGPCVIARSAPAGRFPLCSATASAATVHSNASRELLPRIC